MTKRLLGALATLALALGVGCKTTSGSGEQGPPDDTGKPIPLVQEPEFNVPDDIEAYPDFYKRSKCVLRASRGKLTDEEFDNFVDGFSEQFFGVCFTSVDTDVLNKARQEAALFTNVPPGAALAQMANKANCDFTVFISLDMADRALEASDQVHRRDVSGKVRADGTVNLVGGASKSTKEVATTLKLDQIFSSTQKQELRGNLAKLMGKCVARKLLAQVAQAKGVSAENEIDLTFKHFDDNQKMEVKELLTGIKGVNANAVREVSAGGKADQFIFRVSTTLNLTEMRNALEVSLQEREYEFGIRQPQANMIEVTNKEKR
ncbi:MAG: hypothetical protein AB7N76_08015 [Planctomycetota bacterium]